MTFSYSQPVNGVFTDPKDEVRFLLSDTVEDPEISLSDEEIEFLLKTYDNVIYLAASQGAMSLATNHGLQASVTSRTIGDMSLSQQYHDNSMEYKALSEYLRKGKAGNLFRPYFVEKPMEFTIGQFDENRP
jgi:hypothetical protein